jgi:hypothetical protein
VKTFRIWLLVFLAVLLPIRGAVAAGMLCETEPARHAVAQTLHLASSAAEPHHGDDGDRHGHTHASTSSDDAVNEPGSSSGTDACNLCVAYCSVTALPGSLPCMAVPVVSVGVSYPYAAAAAPSFIPGGLERPPRSF